MTTFAIASRAGETSDRGSDTVGSDHEISGHLALPLMTIPEAYAADAPVSRADEVDELRFERDLGAGSSRGIDKHPVNDGSPRRVEPVDVVLRFDLHLHELVTIMK
jgi:hypothetical protein